MNLNLQNMHGIVENSGNETHRVGRKKANGLGVI